MRLHGENLSRLKKPRETVEGGSLEKKNVVPFTLGERDSKDSKGRSRRNVVTLGIDEASGG